MTTTWNSVNKASAPSSWTDVARPTPTLVQENGVPIGLLLALTHGASVDVTWTSISKATQPTNWTNIAKAT